ncbi:hypothetical protein [Prosthecobacter sp.]|uniref:hypothetical protein n=1 Tax=Prosthecobacter sp. TaxID=1965333 RepID=UPI0037838E4A
MNSPGIKKQVEDHWKRLQESFGAWSMNAGPGHFFTVAVPVSRPDESLKVMVLPLTVLVPVVLPCASRKVVLSVFDCEAVPVVLPWASLKVVVVPDVLVVVEDLPFSSLNVAFLPASVEAGSAKARMGNRRT